MKKLIFGLLIIAAGAGLFFYLQNKKQTSSQNNIQKELLIGKWKMSSIQEGKDSSNNLLVGIMGLVDSNILNYDYEFTKDQKINRFLGDSLTKDSSVYEWNKNDQLIWKEYYRDSVGEALQVLKLNNDSLQLQDKDSMLIYFTKVK